MSPIQTYFGDQDIFLLHYKRVQTLLLVEDQEDGDMLKPHSCSTEDTFRTYGRSGT